MLWRCVECVLHLPTKRDELNDPMVLPMVGMLQELHILTGIIQFQNFWFLAGGSFFLDGLGVINDWVMGASFGWFFRKINSGARSARGVTTKPIPWNWRHVGMAIDSPPQKIHERMVWEEWEDVAVNLESMGQGGFHPSPGRHWDHRFLQITLRLHGTLNPIYKTMKICSKVKQN